MSTFKTSLLSFLILLTSTAAFAQSGPQGAHPGIGSCPSGQVVNRLLPNAGPPTGCVSVSSVLPNPITVPVNNASLITNGVVQLNGTTGNGTDHIAGICVNGACPVTAFGARPGAITPAVVTATTNGTGAVTLSAAGDHVNKDGVMIAGAGTACNINSTDCGSITPGTPTVTQHGYNAGTHTYAYEITAADVGRGTTAVGTSAQITTGVAVLTEPHGTLQVGNYQSLAWTATTGADHYCLYRNEDAAGFVLWAEPITNSFNDWSNHITTATNGGCPATPPGAAVADWYLGTIVSGGGSTSLAVTPAVTQTGSFVLWKDDTAAFQAAENAATTIGGTVTVPTGTYKVRTISMQSNTNLWGDAPEASALGTQIFGTGSWDVLQFAAAVTKVGIKNIAVQSGRNSVATINPGGSAVTHITLDNVTLQSPEFADIEWNGSVEEWYGKNILITGAWYGIDQNGSAYIEKSHLEDILISASSVNGIHINTNSVVFAGNTFTRITLNSIKQDQMWISAPTQGVTFDGYNSEGAGADWTRVNTTATCVNTSNVYAFTSVVGINIGDLISVTGCGATNDLIEGYICAGGITGNNVTLMDPTCSTPVNASVTNATPQFTSNSPYDNIFLGSGGGGFGSFDMKQAITATSGGTGGTNTRFTYNHPGLAIGFEDSAGGTSYEQTYVDSMVNTQEIEYAKVLAGSNFPSGVLHAPGPGSPSNVPSGVSSSPGGDYEIFCMDSTQNQSGTVGSFRLIKSNSNRSQEFIIDCSTGNVTDNAGTVAAVAVFGSATASITGGGALATGSNSIAGEVTGSAATLNKVTTGATCAHSTIPQLTDKTTPSGATITAVDTLSFTFSATAGDVVDYHSSCR